MAIPKNIGKYYVREELGRGASSVVYRGYDPFTNRDVAIKVFNPTGFSNDEQRKKFSKLFMTEAAMVGKLNHPHIINIYDGVVDGEMDYIVMELVEGKALDEHAEVDKLLPIPTVMQLMFKCSSALDYACQQGVIHRDIKPANIMYTPEGEIKIADFGASLIVNMEQTQLAGVGSPAYMSPEQVREDALTHQTDIYSLGVVMYKLLTGRFPFDAENTYALINKILNDPPLNISDLRPEIPPALAAIVHRAMEKDTKRRYSQWSELTADLATCVMQSEPATISIEDSEKFNTLKALAFFADFDDVELWEVLRISQWEKHAKGKVLMQEGDAGNFFLVLAEGSVLVTKTNKMLTTLKKGDCFGEMAYIDESSAQRSATVTASTPVTVINIQASALEQASNNLRLKFNSTFLKILVKRLAFANTRLAYLMS
jgi:eukaryotic-like serine/threonine-protein kinase